MPLSGIDLRTVKKVKLFGIVFMNGIKRRRYIIKTRQIIQGYVK